MFVGGGYGGVVLGVAIVEKVSWIPSSLLFRPPRSAWYTTEQERRLVCWCAPGCPLPVGTVHNACLLRVTLVFARISGMHIASIINAQKESSFYAVLHTIGFSDRFSLAGYWVSVPRHDHAATSPPPPVSQLMLILLPLYLFLEFVHLLPLTSTMFYCISAVILVPKHHRLQFTQTSPGNLAKTLLSSNAIGSQARTSAEVGTTAQRGSGLAFACEDPKSQGVHT